MGADWIRKSEEKYRHCMQRSEQGFAAEQLFPVQEKVTITYPCHWIDEEKTAPIGTPSLFFKAVDEQKSRFFTAQTSLGK